MPNIVFVFTDTTNKHHLGCYGEPGAVTPHTDRLAEEGVRFDRSYCSAPVCTPARGTIMTGLHAPVNGAWYNDATPYRNVPMMGDIFKAAGVKVGYTGKWHLDGGLYNGYGKAEGGFPQEWWYDGKCYVDDIGPEKAKQWKQFARHDYEGMLENAFPAEDCWGHRVTNRAIDFLEKAGDDPFLLCVAYDEPHGPFMAPREFLEAIDPSKFKIRPNVIIGVPEGKPAHQEWVAHGHNNTEEDLRNYWRYYLACNSFIDSELGRLVDAVERLHGDDTYIIFTSDHGEQMGSHGGWGKGYTAYNENINTPLIIKGPNVARGAVSQALAGQIDLLPTLCDMAGIDKPEHLQGRSLMPVLRDPDSKVNEHVFVTYSRFGNDGEPEWDDEHDADHLFVPGKQRSEFYPWRAVVDQRYKLVINLLDTDELYDLEDDPYEMTNRINDPALASERDRLHKILLDELVHSRDPMRCTAWAKRAWS
ncbi:MAG: sulfatase-like hydrolase/transferase [Candidatus Sumerlaeia bacterium]